MTRPVRSLFHELRRKQDWREAVVSMDMAAAAELVSLRQMWDYHETHRRWRRASLVPKALGHASERSRSPAETRLRLLWTVDAGLPLPLVNQEVYDLEGRLVCVADLLDPTAGVVVEYDGAEHRGARRHSRDVAREERCRRVGLEYCKVTGPDMHTPEVVLSRFTSTRSRAVFAVPDDRRWTLQPPRGRQPPRSLHERIERREWIAARMAEQHGLTLPPW